MKENYKTIYSDENNELIYFPTEKRITFIHNDSANDYYLNENNDGEYGSRYSLIEHIVYRYNHHPYICAYIVNEICKLSK